MDPLVNLNRQVEIAQEVQSLLDDDDLPGNEVQARVAALANELAELVLALHNWRRAGGFDPYAASSN